MDEGQPPAWQIRDVPAHLGRHELVGHDDGALGRVLARPMKERVGQSAQESSNGWDGGDDLEVDHSREDGDRRGESELARAARPEQDV